MIDMTSKEYYIGFQNNDQQIITIFYEKFSNKFRQTLRSKYKSICIDDDFMADIYQDSFMRLYENIQDNKVTLESLTSDLSGYLLGICSHARVY